MACTLWITPQDAPGQGFASSCGSRTARLRRGGTRGLSPCASIARSSNTTLTGTSQWIRDQQQILGAMDDLLIESPPPTIGRAKELQ